MSTITFDTREFINEPKNIGFSEEQAEIIAKLHKATGGGVDTRSSWVRGFMMPPPVGGFVVCFYQGSAASPKFCGSTRLTITLRYATQHL